MIGTWRTADDDFPRIDLSTDGRVRLHSPDNPPADLSGTWRIEKGQVLVLLLNIPPNDVLPQGAKEAMRFQIVDSSDSTMTLENDDGSIHVRYEKVPEEA